MKDRLQRQRFEHKYIVTEHVALGIRDFVSSYLDLDAHATAQPDLSYPVHTLYLDSPDFILYQNTINGDRNRFKLRIRFYENDGPDGPAHFEIKRRVNNVIIKKRAVVRRDAAPLIVSGHFPESRHLVRETPGQLAALDEFSTHVGRLRARPRVHVSYRREAWMAAGSNSVRVTIDRGVRIEPQSELRLDTGMIHPVPVFRNDVVVELKFTDRFPDWFTELVQAFGLRQGSAAKYVDGVVRMGRHGLMSAYL